MARKLSELGSKLVAEIAGDARPPANLWLLPLPPSNLRAQPGRTGFGGLLKARVANRLYPTVRNLEENLIQPTQVAGLIHRWLADQTNSGVPV